MLQGWQRAAGYCALVIVLWDAVASFATGASVVTSTDFTVIAPSQRLADKVVERADAYSFRIVAEWLGGEPPATRTPTTIFVEIDDTRSFARTLVAPAGGRHLVWIIGPERAVTEHLLHHEIAHVALAAKFGDRMPTWANEGIASRYDNSRRKELRDAQLAEFVGINSWPPLERLFSSPIRQKWQYAAAVSVTNYLVERGGRETFVDFVSDTAELGWHPALLSHYGIHTIDELQNDWQHAVRRAVKISQQRRAIVSALAPSSVRSLR